ncbi:MAG: hypothetical protein QW066_06620 [Candidatus Methanomethylicia archaeon]
MNKVFEPVNIMVKVKNKSKILCFIKTYTVKIKLKFYYFGVCRRMKRILKSNLIEILPSLLLLILTLYATYTIIISIDLIGKTYFIGKMFKVKVASINLEIDELEAKIIINYTIINPIDISIKILSIQSIIYSDNTYIWNNIESYYSREIIIKSTVITEIIKFTIPQEKLKYISNKFSIKTYIICEIMEPKSRRIILEFNETIPIQ